MVRIKRPFLWLGQIIKGNPRPWRHFKVEGVMVNAYEILQNQDICTKIRTLGVHDFLKFDGYVMMDSGGFQFMKRNLLDINPLTVLKIYVESKPNYAVILDHPISPNLSRYTIRKRQMKTLKNTKTMLKAHLHLNPQLIPVIHGHTIKSVNWFVDQLETIGNFDMIGIGSMVPSVFSMRGAPEIRNMIRIISFIRRKFPDKWIHVFGVGSALTMHLMFQLGIDSVDSVSWRMKAAFGAIQLPGVGDRYISPRKRHKKYRNLSKDELALLETCKCPACKENSLEGLIKSFTLRALHNAWVYQQEVLAARKLIKNNEYDEYVDRILRKTRYSRLLDYVKELKQFDYESFLA